MILYRGRQSLFSSQGLASEDDKGPVSNRVTFALKPEAKGDLKLTNVDCLHPGSPTTSRVHIRACTSRTRFDAQRAVLWRAILGAQFILQADVLRAFTLLDTDCRDGELRERGREAITWGRAILHFGVMVNLKLYDTACGSGDICYRRV